ncbi:MAG TPA: AAA family ATPase, partial [bacterium]|nr:AAA family ATPase [bacterium]
MRRYLETFISEDLKTKIVLLSGPRQVGKTTLSKQLDITYTYLNFDDTQDRKVLSLKEWDRDKGLIIFD